MQTLYHGGLAGRRVGDQILPPAITKTRPDWHRNAQRVFVSTEYQKAVCYAVGRPLMLGREEVGKVYRVQPHGPLTVDPEDYSTPPFAYYCESARVLEVISPSVEDVMQVDRASLADFLGNPAWITSCSWQAEFYLLSLLVRYAIHANESPAKALALYRAARGIK